MVPARVFVTILLLAAPCLGATAELPSRALLFAPPDAVDVTLSPDGRHVAFLALESGRTNLWVAPVDQPDAARALIGEPGRSVFAYAWAGDSERLAYLTGRHLVFWTDNRGGDDSVLYAIDLRTRSSRKLAGPFDRRVKFRGSTRRPGEIFLSPSPRLPGSRAERIDLASGARTILDGPDGLAPVYADDDLQPRLASRSAAGAGIEIFGTAGNSPWRSLRTFTFAERLTFEVHGFTSRGAAIVTHAGEHDLGALYALEPGTGRQTLIARREDAVISDVLLHAGSGKPVAYRSGRLRYQWTALDRRYARDFERLAEHGRALAGHDVDVAIVSRNASDSRWIVAQEGDTLSRRYFLYERRSRALRELFAESRARTGCCSARTHAFEFQARDGLTVAGQLTLPAHAASGEGAAVKQPLPLVVWVHGGPQGQETWRFDSQAQWLASRGYAFMSVNFRGSTGFGRRFIDAAYGEWGGRMRDDLVDAVRWAVERGIADPKRTAIMGLSYGGYATLDALATEPEVFACGSAIVGLTDLNLFLQGIAAHFPTVSDPMLRAESEGRLARDRRQLGADERTPEGRATLMRKSPLANADRIRAPVLLTHGLLDNGIVPAHSQGLAEALAARGAPVAYVTYANEGHGLGRTENRVTHAAIVEAFLAKCLGGEAAPMLSTEFRGSTLAVPIGVQNVPGLSAVLEEARRDGN